MPNDTTKNQGPPGLEFDEQRYKKKLGFAIRAVSSSKCNWA